MLKKMRWRFIGAAMAAFTAVVLTLLCFVNLWNYHSVTSQQLSLIHISGAPAGAAPDDMSNAMPSGAAPAGAPENGADAENAPPADDKAVATQNTSAVKAGIADAPLAIVVSCSTGAELNAGLACQNMSVTAQLLGYGSKIISSPTIALNGEKQEEYREVLGIPEDYTAVAILLIGYEDTTVDQTADTYSGCLLYTSRCV